MLAIRLHIWEAKVGRGVGAVERRTRNRGDGLSTGVERRTVNRGDGLSTEVERRTVNRGDGLSIEETDCQPR